MPTSLEIQQERQTNSGKWEKVSDDFTIGPTTHNTPDILFRKPKSPGLWAKLSESELDGHVISMVTAFSYLGVNGLSDEITWHNVVNTKSPNSGEFIDTQYLPAMDKKLRWRLTRVLKIEK